MKRLLFALSCCLPVLAGCSYNKSPSLDFFPSGFQKNNGVRYSIIGLAISVPPLNDVIFGPCEAEFGMPESRQANCDIHHYVRGNTAPWADTKAAARATNYPPGSLYCQRTIGGVTDCMVVSGRPHEPKLIAPAMGSN